MGGSCFSRDFEIYCLNWQSQFSKNGCALIFLVLRVRKNPENLDMMY